MPVLRDDASGRRCSFVEGLGVSVRASANCSSLERCDALTEDYGTCVSESTGVVESWCGDGCALSVSVFSGSVAASPDDGEGSVCLSEGGSGAARYTMSAFNGGWLGMSGVLVCVPADRSECMY